MSILQIECDIDKSKAKESKIEEIKEKKEP